MKRSSRLDPAALLGMMLTVAVVVGAHWLEGGLLRTLVQGPAALVVFGGTAAALMVSYPFGTLVAALKAAARTFQFEPLPDRDLVAQLARYALRARRKGLLSLESEIAEVADPFLARGLELAVDGFAPAEVRRTLETDSQSREHLEERAAEVFEAAAGYAPTLGILGAVLGLIHVMDNLAAPSKLGAGIAIAFVATVYGVGSANLIFMPIATKLRTLSRTRQQSREMVIEAIAAIQVGTHPRIVEQQLLAFLTARDRTARDEQVA